MSRISRALKGLTKASVEHVSKAKRSSMDRESIEELLMGHKLSQSIHLAIKRCQGCNKKQLKSSTDKPGIERCRDCFKMVFQEGKNTDMNAIKHATQPRIQTTF